MNFQFRSCTVFTVTLLGVGVLSACSPIIEDCGQLPQDHTMGNAGCMILQEGRLLLVQQKISGHWALPGGTAERGERAACTAVRETREETGFQVNAQYEIREFENGFHLYLCEIEETGDSVPLDRLEIASSEWFDEAQRKTIPMRFEQQRSLVDQLAREQAAKK